MKNYIYGALAVLAFLFVVAIEAGVFISYGLLCAVALAFIICPLYIRMLFMLDKMTLGEQLTRGNHVRHN